MITLAPRPREGAIITIVYDALLEMQKAAVEPDVDSFTPHGVLAHLEENADISPKLETIRICLNSGKSCGYFIDSKIEDQRFFRISDMNNYTNKQLVFRLRRTDPKPAVHNTQTGKERPWWKKLFS